MSADVIVSKRETLWWVNVHERVLWVGGACGDDFSCPECMEGGRSDVIHVAMADEAHDYSIISSVHVM